MLQGFRGDVVHGKCKERFQSYVQRAMTTEAATTVNPADKMVEVLNVDCLKLSPVIISEQFLNLSVQNSSFWIWILTEFPTYCIYLF
jgi:hypothetical protein